MPVNTPTEVIPGCEVFTESVLPVFVKPVPARRYDKPSVYALVTALVAAIGVGTVTCPVTFNVDPMKTAPVIPAPPDTVIAPVVLLVLGVAFVIFTIPLDVSDVNIPTCVICV